MRPPLTYFWSLLIILLSVTTSYTQVVEVAPVFPRVSDNVTITFHAEQGNGALLGVSPVYAHTGLITSESVNGSDWKYVQGNWGTPDPKVLMESQGSNIHTISYTIRDYYGVPAGEDVKSLAFVFRNANGSVVGRNGDGADIFYPVYPDDVEFLSVLLSPQQASLALFEGEEILVKGAVSQDAELFIIDNEDTLASAFGEVLEFNLVIDEPGFHEVQFIAKNDEEVLVKSFTYTVIHQVEILDPPPGRKNGFTALNETTAYFQLYAPGKSFVHLVGDMTDWKYLSSHQLKRSVDGSIWWIELTGFNPEEGYRYQYVVDGNLRIADPYSTLVLDNFNDGFISHSTYPHLPPYPHALTNGIVSYVDLKPVQTTSPLQPKPARSDLIIYEILLRDFIATHDYQTLTDTLDYLKKLGINAIELMPVQEFEGNISWGYNPSYHMALDKYYGTIESFHTFIRECHDRDIAVILDVVYNHAFGQSPLAQLYWNATLNRPDDQNPWLNPVAKHDFNVGYDFNHESPATKAFVKQVMQYWVETFGIDGFRFDLSKGFTQNNTLGNTTQWGAYDQSRINILQEYADFLWGLDPEFYVILEHFADNDEEKELSSRGMMLWGNMNTSTAQGSMGYGGSDISNAYYVNRQWTEPHLVAYMESHDEERIMRRNLVSGNSAPGYDIKNLHTALGRMELVTALFHLIPGPKLIWQFGELGYDYSINTCTNGEVSNDCRLDPKPIRWDYLNEWRRQRIYDITRAVLHLRNETAFRDGAFSFSLANQFEKRINITHTEMDIAVVGNYHLASREVTPGFSKIGVWYDYISGDSIEVSELNMTVPLNAGEYRIYTTRKVDPGFDITTDLNDFIQVRTDVKIVPMPNEGNFEIHFPTAGLFTSVRATDVSGKDIPCSYMLMHDSTIKIEMNAPSGIYLLWLIGKEGIQIEKVVIK